MGLFLPLLVEQGRVYRMKAQKDYLKNTQLTCSKIDIFLHTINQNKHLNKISLLRAVSTNVHKFIYFSEEKWGGVRETILCRNADAQ